MLWSHKNDKEIDISKILSDSQLPVDISSARRLNKRMEDSYIPTVCVVLQLYLILFFHNSLDC